MILKCRDCEQDRKGAPEEVSYTCWAVTGCRLLARTAAPEVAIEDRAHFPLNPEVSKFLKL